MKKVEEKWDMATEDMKSRKGGSFYLMGDIIASMNANVKDLGERKILIMQEEGNSSRSRVAKEENKGEILCTSGVANIRHGLI